MSTEGEGGRFAFSEEATIELTVPPGVENTRPPMGRQPALLVQRGPNLGAWYFFPAGDFSVEVGRDRAADFPLPDGSVSRRHARFRRDAETGGIVVADLGSKNGTRINGRPLQGSWQLAPDDRITVGDVLLRFRLLDPLDRAFALDVAEAVQEAQIDPLTGLFTRRFLAEQLPNTVSAARRAGRLVSVLMIDIDHFKAVNDEFGHAVGDAVISRVASTIRGHIRGEDAAIRYGGEEICVTLPGADEPRAAAVAERIRHGVETLDLAALQPALRVTVSVGHATLQDDEAIGDCISRADAGLYRAKADGRNRTRRGPEDAPGLATR
jgi:two-component system cell cycle response regulator